MIYHLVYFFFFFQAEDGIRDLVRSRGLGDVYKRQVKNPVHPVPDAEVLFVTLDVDIGSLALDRVNQDLSLIHI